MRQFQYGRLAVRVDAPNREVIRAAYGLLSDHGKTYAMREARHQWLREILAVHYDHQQLVEQFQL